MKKLQAVIKQRDHFMLKCSHLAFQNKLLEQYLKEAEDNIRDIWERMGLQVLGQ